MTEDKLYEEIQKGKRRGLTSIESLHNALVLAGVETLHFQYGENNLYVRCDRMSWTNIDIIYFLVHSFMLKMTVTAFTIDLQPVPFLHISTI